jgi:hypothetical protein
MATIAQAGVSLIHCTSSTSATQSQLPGMSTAAAQIGCQGEMGLCALLGGCEQVDCNPVARGARL